MKKLLLRLFLFVFPALIILSYPFFVMVKAGEFMNVEKIIKYQNSDEKPYLILNAYSDPWSYVKLKSMQNQLPNVLVIGTSRVMQFRSKFFQTSFYNGARVISDLSHLNIFWNQIPKDHNPKVLILGLDPNLLNPNWTFSSTEELYRKPSWKEWLRIFAKNWDKVYQDEINGNIHIREIFDEGDRLKKIGLAARADDRGFLNDGSFLYGDYVGLSIHTRGLRRKEEYKKALKQIEEGKGVYAPSNEISAEKMEMLENFLREAAERKTHVVAYIPPFAPAIYKILLEKKDKYGYLFKLYESLEPLFHKYGHRIYDFQDPSTLEASDDDFVDDLHDAGHVTLNLFLKMIQSDPHLNTFSSSHINELKKEDLRTLVSPFPAK